MSLPLSPYGLPWTGVILPGDVEGDLLARPFERQGQRLGKRIEPGPELYDDLDRFLAIRADRVAMPLTGWTGEVGAAVVIFTSSKAIASMQSRFLAMTVSRQPGPNNAG